MLFSSSGKGIRFKEESVRAMGRAACGVRGIKLLEDQKVIALIIADEGYVLSATKKGYGKRTAVDDYPVHGRGGQGVIAIQTTERNGDVVGSTLVNTDDEIMIITSGGTMVRTRVDEVSIIGRNTQGVRLISLNEDERLSGIERIADVGGNVEIEGVPHFALVRHAHVAEVSLDVEGFGGIDVAPLAAVELRRVPAEVFAHAGFIQNARRRKIVSGECRNFAAAFEGVNGAGRQTHPRDPFAIYRHGLSSASAS